MHKDDSEPPVISESTTLKRPIVSVSYSGYEPPFHIEPIVQRLIDSVPEKYLTGLKEIVLTNSSGLSRKRRRAVTKSRNRKVKQAEARGLYHPSWRGRRAWIEIFVDNALAGWDKGLWLRISFIREARIGDVLFHEIGHHIHFTCHPEHREREDVADVWKVRLERGYHRNRHRWMKWPLRMLRPLIKPILDRMLLKITQRQLQKGAISRAEFEESLINNTTKD